MVISETYRELNRQLHHSTAHYGAMSDKWAGLVRKLYTDHECKSVLDYGCGKGSLGKALSDLPISGYDPAVPGLDSLADPADLVVCTDVMEHIEPEYLDAVLDDLERVTKVLLFVVVSTIPAIKKLPDGRNAHLIQQPGKWWVDKFWARWEMVNFKVNHEGEFMVLLKPQGER